MVINRSCSNCKFWKNPWPELGHKHGLCMADKGEYTKVIPKPTIWMGLEGRLREQTSSNHKCDDYQSIL